MNQTTFLYCLCEPGTKEIRYFGKADAIKHRLETHISDAKKHRRSYCSRWIKGLLNKGQRPDMHVLCSVPVAGWERFERAFISIGRTVGMRLTNLTAGGEGTSGIKQSAETIAKRVSKIRGLKRTAAQNEANRLRQLGKVPSAETRAKLRAMSLLHRHTPETLLKMRVAQLERRKREREARRKLSFPG